LEINVLILIIKSSRFFISFKNKNCFQEKEKNFGSILSHDLLYPSLNMKKAE
jgi:hypothetical protein